MEERKNVDNIFRKVFEISYFGGINYQKRLRKIDYILVKNNF